MSAQVSAPASSEARTRRGTPVAAIAAAGLAAGALLAVRLLSKKPAASSKVEEAPVEATAVAEAAPEQAISGELVATCSRSAPLFSTYAP